MVASNPPPSTFKVFLGIAAYALQSFGLLLMPVAVAAGFWIQSNQGLWWELWFALAGMAIFFTGRTLLRWVEIEAAAPPSSSRKKQVRDEETFPEKHSDQGDHER